MPAKTPQDRKKKQKKTKAPTMAQITPVSQWKRADEALFSEVPLALPSGNVCLVRPVGAQALIKDGLVPNPLIPVIKEMLDRAQKGIPTDSSKMLQALSESPDSLAAIFQLTDDITTHCVVQPKIRPVPDPDEDGHIPHVDGELYVDQVDQDDKLFVMQFVMGGTRQLDPFRAELAAAVASAHSIDPVEPETD